MNTWFEGNSVELLENGEGFFPRVFQAIRDAQREVIVETFILFEDKVGLELHGDACQQVKDATDNKVDIIFGCKGKPIK